MRFINFSAIAFCFLLLAAPAANSAENSAATPGEYLFLYSCGRKAYQSYMKSSYLADSGAASKLRGFTA
jgi:hypothetical protein